MIGAVIGTGYMGATHAAILCKLTDKLLICSADEATGKAMAKTYGGDFYADYIQMMDEGKPDFVSVCVPTFLHPPVVKAALERNIPVLCEKPFTLDADTAISLLNLAREKQVLLMVAHCLRFSRPYAYLKECISDGRFGPLRSLHMYRNSAKPGWSVGNWFANVARSGGIIRDLHIHDTDMAVNLLGAPKAVYTTGSDCGCCTVFSYDGITVTADASWRNTPAFPFSAGFDAVFENACLVYEKDILTLYEGDNRTQPLETAVFSRVFSSADMMENELRYFLYCVESGVSPDLCHPAETVQTMLVSCAQSRSAEKKKFEPVHISDDISESL